MSKLVYLVIAIVIGAQIALHYPELPERVASHFDIAGNPNDYMSKSGLVIFYVCIATFVLGLFGAMPWILRRLPNSLINIPNRDYWLAPERREQTIETVSVLMDVFSAGIGALLVVTFELTFRASESGDGHLPAPWLVLGTFLAFVAIWVGVWLKRFSKAPV